MLATAPHDPGKPGVEQADGIFACYIHSTIIQDVGGVLHAECHRWEAKKMGWAAQIHVQSAIAVPTRAVSGASRSCVSLLQAAGTSTLVCRLTAPLPGASRRLSAPASEVNFPLRA